MKRAKRRHETRGRREEYMEAEALDWNQIRHKVKSEWNQVFWDCANGHHSTGNGPTPEKVESVLVQVI